MTDKLDYVEVDRAVAFERVFWVFFLVLESSVLFSALIAAVLLSQACFAARVRGGWSQLAQHRRAEVSLTDPDSPVLCLKLRW